MRALLLGMTVLALACDYQPRPGARGRAGAAAGQAATPVPGRTAVPTEALPGAGACSVTLAVQGMT